MKSVRLPAISGLRLRSKIATAAAVGCILLLSLGWSRPKVPKKIKASANPAAYTPFSRPLSEDEMVRHALDRLTFGPRPGEVERLRETDLHKWAETQLQPERLAENPELEGRLAPLESVRMGIHDTYAHYPPPQAIAAVARGRGQLPEDPELRTLVMRLAERYLKRKEAKAAIAAAEGAAAMAGGTKPEAAIANPNELSDLDLRVNLREILNDDQIATLKAGKPDAKAQVLASIPPERRLDFAWALRPQQRQQLVALAPVELRRTLLMATQPQNVVTNDLAEAKVLRATYSNRQFQELLTDFWFNHFNVFINKGADHYLVPTYERESIRPHVLGKFRTLLTATAQSPAMLFYLDNWQSVSSEAAAAQARNRPNTQRRGLNENYGRELLELHTLGVDGGYTQKDVIEVARCFTGWTIAKARKGGGFEYNDRVHDKGEKVVLGHKIAAGGGMDDGLKVINILSRHPATAHFISLKLAQRFVADDPPPSLVNRMSETFRKSDGDLRSVVSVMVESPEFWSQGAYATKIKTPFEMVVSALRATNADVTSAFALSNELNRLGQPLYRKVEPSGYPSANAGWVSSAGLLDRMNFALALTHNRVNGVKIDVHAWQDGAAKDPMLLARRLLMTDPSAPTKSAIEKMLADPELQKQLAAKGLRTTDSSGTAKSAEVPLSFSAAPCGLCASNAKAGPPQIPSLVAGLTIGSPEFQRR